ncbi:serine/threonine protein phosphatase (calcipressin) regulatory subunit Rcn1 [Schizosaccharomyces osmophilus]|uniref:Serine/threonine protein phosphatase (Calcipressin) regulatory subunit Rcn1 n=1 Tax=Schizosaccharomyces osmophilus TaxID=2545709 RepID=A0AAF0AXH0_9SCHI|nr:serine/threonine protein phosphatase (calcipressin) regulatory subunit Rcn1 [Schizosaccharomyces osmophilus]WBW74148.1 serine/threonine protein phosphatase (calcipressin) regulatory subunit Rcn1 [Schizosaccharomyces osmophilus]
MIVFTTTSSTVEELREFIHSVSNPNSTKVIKGLGKVLAFYENSGAERQALHTLQYTTLPSGTPIDCHYVPDVSAKDPSLMQNSSLKVPKSEKNWLISPPGSPPLGWTPIKEESPNSAHLAHDLQLRLDQLGNGILENADTGPRIVISDADSSRSSPHAS